MFTAKSSKLPALLILAALCSTCSLPSASAAGKRLIEPIFDEIEVIELNHFYDDVGRLVFDQLIFWRADHRGVLQVGAWMLAKRGTLTEVPCVGRRAFLLSTGDAPDRVIHAKSYLQTHTQHDIEMTDRTRLPKNMRVPLTPADKPDGTYNDQ